MSYVARKPVKVLGTRYRPGEIVPLDELPPGVRRRLLEYRRVVPRVASAPEAGLQAGSEAPTERPSGAKPGTCGWFGGRNSRGAPCGITSAGRCGLHTDKGD